MVENRVAIVTGGGNGIGEATAYKIAESGANIVVIDIDETAAILVAEKIKSMGVDALALKVDVSKKNEIEKAIELTLSEFDRIDILVNCAGIIHDGKLYDVSEEEWDKVMSVNLKSMFLFGQAVSKQMKKQMYGRIVNLSSQAGKIGEYNVGTYCVSKAGIIMLTEVQGLELAEFNITANAVCPGYVDTNIMKWVFENRAPVGKTPHQHREELLSTIPLNRMADPEEVGELIAFLTSDKAAYITGISVTIAGGNITV